MKSFKINDMFTNNVTAKLIEDYDATLQNLELLLLTNKGEMFGDSYFGTNLKKYLFDQNDYILKEIAADDIYTAIALFMPQIKVNRKDITITTDPNDKIAKTTITVKATNRATFKTDLYNIVMLQTEE